MELREYALAIVRSDSLSTKLTAPRADLSDEAPGPSCRIGHPGRPSELQIVAAQRAKVPSAEGMPDPRQRVRILHGSANHELQAVELFAWALLAFVEAPKSFRRGLLQLLIDEQDHCKLYISRMEQLGAHFGDFPVSGYFWNKVGELTTPLRFVCAMCLTFETANLDHSLSFADAARKAGDEATARIFDRIHSDEQRHVRFGWRWLQKLKAPDKTAWQSYCESLTYPLRPQLGRGPQFSVAAREQAGLSEEFIARLRD
jgi:uncharacterized ferritin-like protein (DUF455 family)